MFSNSYEDFSHSKMTYERQKTDQTFMLFMLSFLETQFGMFIACALPLVIFVSSSFRHINDLFP